MSGFAVWELHAGAGPVLEKVELSSSGAATWWRLEAAGPGQVAVGRWRGELSAHQLPEVLRAIRDVGSPQEARRPSAGGAWQLTVDGEPARPATGASLAAGMMARSACTEADGAVGFDVRRQTIGGQPRVVLRAQAVGAPVVLRVDADPPGRPTAWADSEGEVLGLEADAIELGARPASGALPLGQGLPVRLHGRLHVGSVEVRFRVVLAEEADAAGRPE